MDRELIESELDEICATLTDDEAALLVVRARDLILARPRRSNINGRVLYACGIHSSHARSAEHPMMTCTLDVESFEALVNSALHDLTEELHHAGMDAAEQGVLAAKQEHPYTDRTGDLTGNAHAEEDLAQGGGIMTWPEDYASYVDKGTSRARPYPFTPRAQSAAEFALEAKTQEAIDRFVARLER